MTIERFPVEAGHIMLFARAIGDLSPDHADGRLAPPTFTMAGAQFDPDYPLRPKPGEPWFGSGREPSGAAIESSGGLHAEQHFEYHQPVRPGMVLTSTEVDGETWQKQSKRGGTLRFDARIVEFRDSDTGELVVTSRVVGVSTERAVS